MKALFTKLSALLLTAVFAFGSANAAEIELFDMKDPHALIKNVSEKTFARFRADRELIDKDLNHLKVIVEEELMPYINDKRAAGMVLGNKHYKKARKDKKFSAFRAAFRDYLILTYANVFTLYDNQKIVYEPAKAVEGKVATVKVTIVDAQRPPVDIDFKLRKNKKTGDWKAYDMVAESISMVSTKAKEFDAIINKKGIDYLINQLNKKAAESVEAKAK
ncbi:ABC transporter substrate-binding protein [Psychrobium sp. MM17-31]|uniref:MlaC/ttg2D family ABC transporter substrate-binding protein n=1 Tax=Psychrobium sp. MM17-31 TaxID=2917758 RepID=UPI001EF50DD6|nr:ABC transporter substrate-binding protein [Psychrobium sp. MM17-31]MCG7531354.1 ABC transporter substrate-binding protein [Psychrobium sp. MM17-31]